MGFSFSQSGNSGRVPGKPFVNYCSVLYSSGNYVMLDTHVHEENTSHHILVIDNEMEMCNSLEKLLTENGFRVHVALSAQSGIDILQNHTIDLVLCDIVMPDMSGLIFLQKKGTSVPVIMMTAYASIETTRKAFLMGAKDYLVKPFDVQELLVVIRQNVQSAGGFESHIQSEKLLTSRNEEFIDMLSLADKFSKTDMSVLITGESGVGKEIIAHYLHENSSRKGHPFVSINCAAIPDTLLESELFGYEKGAFTGAVSRRIGKFETADGGTIFLDEIGDMPITLQSKLLRVLQELSLTRLGGNTKIHIDIRVIAATNKNIYEIVDSGIFREDLFHRLNGVHLKIPPLRYRVEDIEMFIAYFAEGYKEKYNKKDILFDTATIRLLKKYNWPGNLRELKNCIERAIVVCDQSTILPEHLPDTLYSRRATPAETEPSSSPDKLDKDLRNDYMRKIIIDALTKTNGSRIEAARLLNISRKTLYNRMRDLGIKNEFA